MTDSLNMAIDTVHTFSQLKDIPLHLNINSAIKAASNTQFFQGGMLLALIAWLGTRSKGVFQFIFGRLMRIIKYSVYVDNSISEIRYGKFSAYDCMCEWLHSKYPNKFKNVQLTFINTHDANYEPAIDHMSDTIWIWYKYRFITIVAERDTLENANDPSSRFILSYRISGIFAKRCINKILSELNKIHDNKLFNYRQLQYTGNTIHYNESSYWNEKDIVNRKNFDSIFFDGKDELLQDLDQFIINSDQYTKRLGINFKRGYCFEGPPGLGKSATALAMSTYLNRHIYYFNLSAISSDSAFISLMNSVKPNSIIVFEDIDTFMHNRLDGNGADKTKLTFSTLLQTFNGIYEPQNTIIVITTNHYDKLDPALIRTGRIDYTIPFKNPSLTTAMEFINCFYDTNYKISTPIVYDESLSMSDIQELCIRHTNIHDVISKLINTDSYTLE